MSAPGETPLVPAADPRQEGSDLNQELAQLRDAVIAKTDAIRRARFERRSVAERIWRRLTGMQD